MITSKLKRRDFLKMVGLTVVRPKGLMAETMTFDQRSKLLRIIDSTQAANQAFKYLAEQLQNEINYERKIILHKEFARFANDEWNKAMGKL